MTHKICRKCHESKLKEEFHKRTGSKDGVASYCRPCSVAYVTRWQKANPAKFRTNNRKSQRKIRTGFSAPLFEDALRLQDSKCAICSCQIDGSSHADHCHSTGIPRGILCQKCNVGIGMLGDSPARLRAAINYLEDPPLKRAR